MALTREQLEEFKDLLEVHKNRLDKVYQQYLEGLIMEGEMAHKMCVYTQQYAEYLESFYGRR